MNNQFQNFSVLTVMLGPIKTGKAKESGKPYALVNASLFTGEGKPALPVKVVLLGELANAKPVKEGSTLTLLGKLLYEQKGEDSGMLVLRPYQFQEVVDRPRNFVKLTLRVGTEPEGRYSVGGTFWTRLRAALGQGKDAEGNWKPSAWFTVKGFSREGDESIPQALSVLNKGSLVTVSGRLGYDLSQDGQKGYYNLYASKVESFNDEDEELEPFDEPALDQEPIFN
jgi:single-stranded DNA-binding protein